MLVSNSDGFCLDGEVAAILLRAAMVAIDQQEIPPKSGLSNWCKMCLVNRRTISHYFVALMSIYKLARTLGLSSSLYPSPSLPFGE